MGERAKVSPAEMDVLRALWTSGRGTVRDVAKALRRRRQGWAYTTIQTLLGRLESKGYVNCDRSTTPHFFQATVTRENLVRLRLRDLAEELCDGASTPLVMALVKDRKFTPAEIEQFRKLINSAEEESKGDSNS
jgi:predicted transcriptional regulator